MSQGVVDGLIEIEITLWIGIARGKTEGIKNVKATTPRIDSCRSITTV
jgi:hypothetical protein